MITECLVSKHCDEVARLRNRCGALQTERDRLEDMVSGYETHCKRVEDVKDAARNERDVALEEVRRMKAFPAARRIGAVCEENKQLKAENKELLERKEAAIEGNGMIVECDVYGCSVTAERNWLRAENGRLREENARPVKENERLEVDNEQLEIANKRLKMRLVGKQLTSCIDGMKPDNRRIAHAHCRKTDDNEPWNATRMHHRKADYIEQSGVWRHKRSTDKGSLSFVKEKTSDGEAVICPCLMTPKQRTHRRSTDG